MSGFEPFEASPHIAVAVSGGADSVALCLLATAWARRRGGTVTGLTVDHGLRSASRAEAAQVGAWLARRGIAHAILTWNGAKPSASRQAAARQARYDRLLAWCQSTGVLHLLVGHHRQDDAETKAMRRARGPGGGAVAGIAPLVHTSSARILRPLLDVDPVRLRARLVMENQAWIDDPSNWDRAFERVRVRLDGVPPPSLTLGGAPDGERHAVDDSVARLLGQTATFHPLGFAYLDGERFVAAPRPAAEAALRIVLALVGGRIYGPAWDKAGRLLERLISSPDTVSATLHRCRIVRRQSLIAVIREERGLPDPEPATPGWMHGWDGRFDVRVRIAGWPKAIDIPAARLAAIGRRADVEPGPDIARRLPEELAQLAMAGLPAVVDGCRLIGIPGGVSVKGEDAQAMAATVTLGWRPASRRFGEACFLVRNG